MYAQLDSKNKVAKFYGNNEIFHAQAGGNCGRVSSMSATSLVKNNLKLVETAPHPTKDEYDSFTQKCVLIPLNVGDAFATQEWDIVGKSQPEMRQAYIAARAALDPHFLRTDETTLVLSKDVDLTLWDDNDFAACVTSVEYREGVVLDEDFQKPTMRECLGLRAKIDSI